MSKRSRNKRSQNREQPALAVAKGAALDRDWFWALLLILAVIVTYIPVWRAGFIWDDDLVIVSNPVVIGPKGLWEIWTTSAADICPLTLTSFWLEHKLWGLNPLPYHFVNVVLHGCGAVLLWRVLRRLQVPGAWLGAALWALHPVQVESVAWVVELKNTQSGIFFLLSILFFLRSLRPDWNRDYVLSLVFAACAEASKTSTVILPLVLCLGACWVERRWNLRSLAKTIPVFFISAAAGAASLWNKSAELAQHADPQWARTWPERLATAGDAVWFYLAKLIWPYPLLTVYPRWHPDTANWISYLPLLAVFAVLLVLMLIRQPWAKPCLFAFAYFLIALAPVLGLIDLFFLRFSLVADHFQYLASMAPLALVGAALAMAADLLRAPRWMPATLGAVVLIVLGVISSQWSRLYETDEKLWTYVLSKNPDTWLGHNRIGVAQMNEGKIDAAMANFQTALAEYPNFDNAYSNLCVVYAAKGRIDDAIKCAQRAVAINPGYADAHYNLARLLMSQKRLDEAAEQLRAAIRINPDHEAAYTNLAIIDAEQGRDADAVAEFQAALAIVPNDPYAHCDFGSYLARHGRLTEAVTQYQDALRSKPDLKEAQRNLANVEASLPKQTTH